MKQLTLELSDEFETKLLTLAARDGRDPTVVALDILQQWLNATVPAPNPLSHQEWKREFEAWVNSHPKVDVVLDDSRETIYEGR